MYSETNSFNKAVLSNIAIESVIAVILLVVDLAIGEKHQYVASDPSTLNHLNAGLDKVTKDKQKALLGAVDARDNLIVSKDILLENSKFRQHIKNVGEKISQYEIERMK
jgi:hypothetical protein